MCTRRVSSPVRPLGTATRPFGGPDLQHLEASDRQLDALDEEFSQRLVPLAAMFARLQTIPALRQRTAEGILAEIGPTVRAFRTAAGPGQMGGPGAGG